MSILIELTLTVPCTALHAACEAADRLAGGCTVDRTERTGEWHDESGRACIEPVRRVTVATSVLRLGSVVRGIVSALGDAGERAVYVSHSGTGLAMVIPTWRQWQIPAD